MKEVSEKENEKAPREIEKETLRWQIMAFILVQVFT